MAETEFIELVEFYWGDGLEMADNTAIILWIETQHSCCLGLPGQSSFESVKFYLEDGLEMAIHQWHWVKRLHIYCSGFSGHKALQVGRVLLRRCS